MAHRVENLEHSKVNSFIKQAFPPFEEMLKIIVTPDAYAIKEVCVITSYEQAKTCPE